MEILEKIKQVIVVRNDLNMRRGKSEAQVAHASMKVFFDRMEDNYKLVELDRCGGYESPQDYKAMACTFTKEMIEWMKGNFAKIVVGCSSEEELFELQNQANESNIVNVIIEDNGLTEFKEICPNCNGRGFKEYAEFEVPFNDYCKTCNGTGKINKPTFTCLAIGPDKAEKIDKITGHLKLR